MRRLRTLLLLVLIGLAFGAIPSAYAGSVQVAGEELAVVDMATGNFVFRGPVTVTDGNTTIKGQHLVFDSKAGVLQFVGAVLIEQEDASMAGRDLVYDTKNGRGTLADAVVTTTPVGAVAPVHLSGMRISVSEDYTLLESARLTTCELEQPHYYLASRMIEIIPGDRLVLYDVKFVDSGLTIFFWPRITFSLKRMEPDALALPSIGHSATEGWFVKSSFGYRGPYNQKGRILIDYMQLLGWGFGINHFFRSNSSGTDKVSFYAQPNKQTGHNDIRLTLEAEHALGAGLRLAATSSYSSKFADGEQHQYGNRLSLQQARESGSSSLVYSEIRLKGPVSGYETEGSLKHNQVLAGEWHLNLDGELHRRNRSDASVRNLAGYAAELARVGEDWSVSVVAEDRFHPDLTKEVPVDVTWSRARRLPEVSMELHQLRLGGREVPVFAKAAWGKLAEDRLGVGETIRFATQRTQLETGLNPVQLEIGPLGKLEWAGSLARRFYGTGENQWVAKARGRYGLDISERLSLSGEYRYEESFGDSSPFRFDGVAGQETIGLGLSYRGKSVGWSLTGGYDLRTEEPMEAVASARIQPSEALKLQAQAAYSVVDAEWLYAIGTVQYAPSESFTLQFGGKYNVPMQRADRVDAVFNWDLGKWSIGYTGIYDGTKGRFDRGDVTLTRDLDCRAIDLRYNQSRKEVWLEYRITAFPSASVKLGATDKHLMFDARGWEEVLATE